MGFAKMPGRVLRKQRQLVQNKKEIKYTIDLTAAMDDEDQVIDQGHYIDYLKTKLRLNGKALCDEFATVEASGKKVVVASNVKFGKRYLKYLTNKYLKSQDIKSYLRVLATDKLGYKVKFLEMVDGKAEE